MIGTLLGSRYDITEELAEGGMGKTFIGIDTHFVSRPRRVIKQLKPLENNPQIYTIIKEKFQQEAATLEKLGEITKQIPKLHAYFEADGLFYLVQELIEGKTLETFVQKYGPLSEIRVKEIVVNLLQVLEHLQSQRMIHRDIKPQNIILREFDGLPVLIDFGAVKELMSTTMAISGGTKTSIIIGTPGFMPFEQSGGRAVFASDIYALGLTMIYLLTGKYPDELVSQETGQFMWRQYVPNISPGFADILDKAIRDQFQARFLTAKDMLQAIQNLTPVEVSTASTIYEKGLSTIYERGIPTQIEVIPPQINKKISILQITALTMGILSIALGGGLIYFYLKGSSNQPLIPQLQEELTDYQKKLETANQDVERLNTKIKELEKAQPNSAEIDSLKQQNTNLQNQINSLQSQISNLQSENSRLQSENSRLQSQIANARAPTYTPEPTPYPTPRQTPSRIWGGRCGSQPGSGSVWYKVVGEAAAYSSVKQLCPVDQPYAQGNKVIVSSVTSKQDGNQLVRDLENKTGYNFWVE